MDNKISFKALNIFIVVGIIYVLYLLRDVWLGIIGTIISILTPFIIGFVLAYMCYPFVQMLNKKKIPKVLSIILLFLIIILLLLFIVVSLIPVITDQIPSLFNSIIQFFTNIDNYFNLNLSQFKDTLTDISNTLVSYAGSLVSGGAFSLLGTSISIFSNSVISIVAFIYFIFAMDDIRDKIKNICESQSKKFNKVIREMDTGMNNYFKELLLCIIIQFIEYTFLFYIIGHPNFLLLGLLCSLSSIIPYFGGIIANIIAVITASVISVKLFILTLIIAIVCPNIDGYIISPKVYGKTNQLSAMLTIFAVFAGGVLYGFVGILIALPVTIIIQVLYKNYKDDILKKIKL